MARKLLLVSVIYLPLFFLLMVIDKYLNSMNIGTVEPTVKKLTFGAEGTDLSGGSGPNGRLGPRKWRKRR